MSKFVRLPAHIKPERYALIMKPDLAGFVFEGEETISLKLDKSVREITLHAKELRISEVEYKARGKKYKGKVLYNSKAEAVTFNFPKALARGRGELFLKFQGILNDKMRGFYRSSYVHDGITKHMATTQFEATDARRAFPCFDEPAQKAIFDVTLMVPTGLTAISNTLESEILEHEGGFRTVKFASTPKMSTYLLAFIVGDFEFIESKTKDGVLVRVFVTPGKKHQAKFALDTAVRALEFYNNYFQIPYPLPVLDLIAIPDFSHGAMENWGAVTYRESALLVDPEHSSAANKQWVALVIAHELAHQWFGNLVTMEWWTHLWLNEGFASYIEYLAVDHLFPNWDIWTQFAYADMNVALKLDSLKHTHPIEVEVNHPDEIGEIFDEVSYSKGASVIRMLAGYLGEKDFRDGLRYYLKKHSYKNASTIHLWEAFEKVSKKPVSELMHNWTSQPGYPVLKVTERPQELVIRQTRHFSSPISREELKDQLLWTVPISINNSRLTISKLQTKKELILKKPTGPWLKLNFGETGFYRVDYPSQMLQKLQAPVKTKKLSAIDRLSLVRDAFALAESGDLPTTQALELVKGYVNETDFTVWVEITNGLSNVRNILFCEKVYPAYETFCRSILKNIANKIGFRAKKREAHTYSLLRSLVLQQLINYKDKATIEEALKIYRREKVIPADLRSVVYHAVAACGSSKEHQQFILKYKSETLSEEKNRLGRALGQFEYEKDLEKTLKFAFSKEVRIQDTPSIFMSVWNNFVGAPLAWNFIKKNWKELTNRYPASGHMISRFLKPASYFIFEKDAEDFAAFFKRNKASGSERAISQVLEKILTNVKWRERDLEKIANWLNSQK